MHGLTLTHRICKMQAAAEPDRAIAMLIRFIEETIPTKSIYIKEAEEPEAQGKPFQGVKHDEIRKLMKQIYDSLIAQGNKDAEAKSVIINLEPFNYYPEYVENL